MRNRLLLSLVLIGAVSCKTALPPDHLIVTASKQVAQSIAAEPEKTDGVLPSRAVVIGSIDTRRLDEKVGHALDALGPLGLLVLEHSLDIPADALDLAEHGGLGRILALDTSRPLTFALQGPSDAERHAADEIDKLASPATFAPFARAIAISKAASFRGRVLLPSPDVDVTMGRVRALLEGLGFREEPRREDSDGRFASEGKDIVVELKRGRTSLTVDAVRCFVDSTTELDRAADEAFALLRENPSEPSSSPPVERHTFRIEYEPEALARLSAVTSAHALNLQITATSVGPVVRDSLVAGGVAEITQSFRLARNDTGVYFDRVTLDAEDDGGNDTLVVTAHFGGGTRHPTTAPSPSITIPLVAESETLDIDRGFLDAIRLPGTDLRNLFSMARSAGDLGYAIALPSVLPWMARDQLGAVGYGPAPVFQPSMRTRFERLGLTSDATMPEAIFYALLPAGTSREIAACSLAKTIPCSPGDRLSLGATKKYVGPYFVQQGGKSALAVSYARLMSVGDRFVVLAGSDKHNIEHTDAPVPSALPRPPAYSETSLGTLGSLVGLKLPKLPDRTIGITAMEVGDCLDCSATQGGPDSASKRDARGIVFRVSSRSPRAGMATPTH